MKNCSLLLCAGRDRLIEVVENVRPRRRCGLGPPRAAPGAAVPEALSAPLALSLLLLLLLLLLPLRAGLGVLTRRDGPRWRESIVFVSACRCGGDVERLARPIAAR